MTHTHPHTHTKRRQKLETFLRISKSNQTRRHIIKYYHQLYKNKGDKVFWRQFFFHPCCSIIHNDPCRSYTDNHTSTYRLNGGFFLKPATSIV